MNSPALTDMESGQRGRVGHAMHRVLMLLVCNLVRGHLAARWRGPTHRRQMPGNVNKLEARGWHGRGGGSIKQPPSPNLLPKCYSHTLLLDAVSWQPPQLLLPFPPSFPVGKQAAAPAPTAWCKFKTPVLHPLGDPMPRQKWHCVVGSIYLYLYRYISILLSFDI